MVFLTIKNEIFGLHFWDVSVGLELLQCQENSSENPNQIWQTLNKVE